MIPCRSRTTHTETLGDEVCVYEWTRNEVHALNAPAARVWAMCDGRTSERQMIERLGPTWGGPHAADLVRLALVDLTQKHLLAEHAEGLADGGALSRRTLMKRVGLTAAMLPVISSIVAPTALEAASLTSTTFDYTGATQTFMVPSSVTKITVTAMGANGGSGALGAGFGYGAMVTATLAVSPGETLFINVGGVGLSGIFGGVGGVAGGFNGGGHGGGDGGSGSVGSGGGGGASDVRQGGNLIANRVVVAGGGGGGGGAAASGAGGRGGGTNGEDGGNTVGFTNGGGGGTPGFGGAGGSTGPTPSQTGANGTQSGGGAAAVNGGGGGGGGYWGGGGAGGEGTSGTDGGGGGGSSFAVLTATAVTHLRGGNTLPGNGRVVLT